MSFCAKSYKYIYKYIYTNNKYIYTNNKLSKNIIHKDIKYNTDKYKQYVCKIQSLCKDY